MAQRFIRNALIGTGLLFAPQAATPVQAQSQQQTATQPPTNVPPPETDGTIHALTPNGLGPNTQRDFSLSPDGTEFVEKGTLSPDKIIVTYGSVQTLPDGRHEAKLEKITFSSKKAGGKFSLDNTIDATSPQLSAQDQASIKNATDAANSSLQSIAASPYSPWAQHGPAQADQNAPPQQAPAATVTWDNQSYPTVVMGGSTVQFEEGRITVSNAGSPVKTRFGFQGYPSPELEMISIGNAGGAENLEYWRRGTGAHNIRGEVQPPSIGVIPKDTHERLQPMFQTVADAMQAAKADAKKQGIPFNPSRYHAESQSNTFDTLAQPSGGGAVQPGQRKQLVQSERLGL